MKHAALILTALLALTACQQKDDATTTDTKTDTAATDTPTDTPATETPATDTKADAAPAVTEPGRVPAGFTVVPALAKEPVRTFDAEPDMALTEGKDYYALLDTSKGQILVDLYEQETPVTVNNFVFLARNLYFDGIRFHRVIDGFMAQTGDPKSVDDSKKAEWGTGDPGYKFADEFRQKLTFDSGGILAMANSGPATNGSQFFITFEPTEFLNGKHTIFGKVVTGDDTLPKLTRTMDQSNAEIEGATADEILSVRILTKG
ncbi:peptidylprolyl isomerase [Deinococcus sp. LM3]|uniref:peptidylprolyl isomerase n=1 Tax=Deinococcus sp. LM3 TaxID=1938608 RepID=UPI000992CE18|nr:peptidylprolyl isomerase [Deinococcus sp. LM3]OOV14531.1 peptidylprolyl isomerase [Deinococcus sp. LM3]